MLPIWTEFFRAHADASWRLQTMILELKQEGETYVLAAELWGTLQELLRPAVLHTCIDRRNNVFLVPVPLPGSDGRRNQWHQSLSEVVAMAEKKWVRSVANLAVGGYDLFVADAALTEPDWPTVTFEELVQIAFRGRVIESEEHPVVQELLGRS